MNLVEYGLFEAQLMWKSFNKVNPDSISWVEELKLNTASQENLFMSQATKLIEPSCEYIKKIKSSVFYKDYKKLAKGVLYHTDSKKFHCLYSLFYKLLSNPRSIFNVLDDDVKFLMLLKKQISRDIHKMHAFVRFNKVEQGEDELFVANHIPDHYILKTASRHFVERFSGMKWLIFSNSQLVYWNKDELLYREGDFSSFKVNSDDFMNLWKVYYASTFNPSRLKVKAMRNEMPVRYWSKMPETELISDLIKSAPERSKEMINYQVDSINMDSFIKKDIKRESFKSEVTKCDACDLSCNETQQNELHAMTEYVLLFQNYPSESEIKKIKNYIKQSRLDLRKFHVTCVTKHKSLKRDISSVMICRRWLAKEIEIIRPKVLVCFGPVALHSIFGYPAFSKSITNEVHETSLCKLTLFEGKHVEESLLKKLRAIKNSEINAFNSAKKCLTDIR